jgi:RHS repeat-associated protein
VSNGTGPAITTAAARANPDPKTPNQSTRLYSVRDPRGAESTFAYLGTGEGQDRWKLASRKDRALADTTYAYDTVNRVTTVTAPMARVSKFAYDVEGKAVRLTNPKNEVTQVQWTGDRMVQKVIEPTGNYTEFAYDDNGYLTDRWDQERNHTQLVYDSIAVDANDVAGKWKAGRDMAHISQLRTKTDANSAAHIWRFTHDAKGNLRIVQDPEGFTSEAVYNPDGTVVTSYDGNRNATNYTYDLNGLPATVTDAEGRITKFQHTADGLLEWVQDPLHQSSTGGDARLYRSYFYYDSFHRMGRQSAPKSTRHAPGTLIWSAARFDPNDNVVANVDQHYGGVTYPRAGAVSTAKYDAMDRTLERANADTKVDPLGERTQYAYDAAGRVNRITSPKGVLSPATDKDHAVFFDYDALDRPVRQTRYEVDGAGAVTRTLVTQTCFDTAGDKRSVTLPRFGTAQVDCAATTTPFTKRFAYYPTHRLKSETDQNGNTRSYEYDPNGNRTKLTDARNQVTEMRYDKRNLQVRMIVPFEDGATGRKITTAKEYDGAGNLVRDVSARAWDTAPNLASYAGRDFVTSYSYDRTSRMTKVSLPTKGGVNPTFVYREYDPNGNLSATSIPTAATAMPADPKQKTTVEYFDPGWIKMSRDPGENEVNFDYFAQGWQERRAPEDAQGNIVGDRVSTWEYWADGTKSAHHGRDGEVTKYFYDANNNIIQADDASGATKDKQTPVDIRVVYDGLDRPTKVRLKKQDESSWRVATSVYDPDGNVDLRVDDRREDDAGSVVGGEVGRTHDFKYFNNGWLDEQLDSGRKPSVTTDDRRTETDYLPTGLEERRLVQKRNAAGGYDTTQTLTWEYTTNGQKRKTFVRNKDNALVESHDVSYIDNGIYLNGNRVTDTFMRKSPKAGVPCQTTTCTDSFGYDARDRLIRETRTRSGAEVRETTYELWDHGAVKWERGPEGNFFHQYDGTKLDYVQGGGVTTYQHYDTEGNADCTTLNVDKPDACKTATTSTPDGSLIEDYEHDELSRMTRYESFAATKKKTSTYVYDALDRLVEQVDNPEEPTKATTAFTHRGISDQVTQEQKSYADSSKQTKTKSFAYDAVGHRIGMTYERGSTTKDYTYSEDSQGSVSMLIDDAGQAKASYGYTAYGESDKTMTAESDPDGAEGSIVPEGGEETNPFRFSGSRQDSSSETLDMGARRFAPDVAAFTQPDLYENAFDNLDLAQDPLTSNRYALAGGNPISFVEVDGHWPEFVDDAVDNVEESAGDIGGALKDTGESALKEVKGTAEWAYNSANFTNGQKFKETWSNTANTAKAIAEDPEGAAKNVVNSFVNPIKESYRKGGLDAAITRGIGEGAVAVVGGKGLTKLGRLGRAGGPGNRGGRPSCNSFVAGTVILLAGGDTLPIEQIAEGDAVLGTDTEGGSTRAFSVAGRIFGRGAKQLVELTIDGRQLVLTAQHPVYLPLVGRWIAAGDLRAGTLVRRADGSNAAIESVHRFAQRDRQVYNLEVAEAHTYYAGDSAILVHNGGDCGDAGEPTRYQPEGNQDAPSPGSSGGPTAFERFGAKQRSDKLDRNPYCVWCGNPADAGDHVEARSKGGNATDENLDSICTPCNSSKRDRPTISQKRWRGITLGEIGRRFSRLFE